MARGSSSVTKEKEKIEVEKKKKKVKFKFKFLPSTSFPTIFVVERAGWPAKPSGHGYANQRIENSNISPTIFAERD